MVHKYYCNLHRINGPIYVILHEIKNFWENIIINFHIKTLSYKVILIHDYLKIQKEKCKQQQCINNLHYKCKHWFSYKLTNYSNTIINN